MKAIVIRLLFLWMFLAPGSGWMHASELRVRQPVLDAGGRFWVYRNGLVHPPLPFLPYGWMSDSTNLTEIIHVDLDCTDDPNRTDEESAYQSEKQTCIQVKINWADSTWATVAFISGPDTPPWWGEDARGRYYDLSLLPKKKLIFYARGGHGGEDIKAEIGVLGKKPFGDSLSKPVITDDITLTPEWTRHEIDLKSIPDSELKHICNGFGVTAERDSQPGTADHTVFYLDDIYYE